MIFPLKTKTKTKTQLDLASIFILVPNLEALNENVTLQGEKEISSKASVIYSLLGGNEHACCLTEFCDYPYKNFKRYATFYLSDNDSLSVQYIVVNCPSFLLYF